MHALHFAPDRPKVFLVDRGKICNQKTTINTMTTNHGVGLRGLSADMRLPKFV